MQHLNSAQQKQINCHLSFLIASYNNFQLKRDLFQPAFTSTQLRSTYSF